jgi:23S rRNA (cytosine1962-C5)-methyltransferase
MGRRCPWTKTGYFLDQKENRAALAPYVQNARVLDCFCHVGAFSLHAAHYGARETLGIDISESTIDWAQKNAQANGLTEKCTFRVENAFDALRAMEHKQERFDVVVLDPPAFTKSRSTVQSATRGYKDINLRGMRLLQDGGFLVTCSCSQHMLPNMFLDVVQDAAKDAKRTLRLIEQRTQAKDHPILAGMPESNYLKCNIYQVYHR